MIFIKFIALRLYVALHLHKVTNLAWLVVIASIFILCYMLFCLKGSFRIGIKFKTVKQETNTHDLYVCIYISGVNDRLKDCIALRNKYKLKLIVPTYYVCEYTKCVYILTLFSPEK